MEKCDQDTVIRSLTQVPKILDLNATFLSLVQGEHRIFSEEMIEDILVCLLQIFNNNRNCYLNFIYHLEK